MPPAPIKPLGVPKVARPPDKPSPTEGARHGQKPPDLEKTTAEPADKGKGQKSSSPPSESTGAWEAPTEASEEDDDANSVRGKSSPGKANRKAAPSSGKSSTRAASPDVTTDGESTDFETDQEELGIPEFLGGYQVLKQLGQGGMGTVYLARQISLDRRVALKVMNPQWASNPNFLARFTREAYAAAQLVHHNVVQIYDIGADKDVHYFSMEFVQGKNLGQVLKDNGPLDVEVATGYILQAARGLKFAHDQGMVHRDIKPDNLMLNDQGLVKVADLGLVKTPGSAESEEAKETEASSAKASKDKKGAKLSQVGSVTQVGVAMGTPAYMAPEQGRNAAEVDHRADIYSLGCTLYVLLTGRPPFQGKTAVEVITKHFTEPIVRPEVIVKRVPKELSDILVKMMAKKPADRHQNLGEVIADLERFLGIQQAGPFTPKEEHADMLEECVKEYNAAPARRLRSLSGLIFFATCGLLVVLSALIGRPLLAGGFLGLALMTPLCCFLVNGVTFKTHLFIKSRELLFSSSWGDWLTWTVAGLLVLLVLYLVGLLWWWLAFLVLAVLLALACYFLVERRLAAQRQPTLEKVEGLMRTMRLGGLEEDAIRQFVCKYAGDHWEPLYEALFDYEHLIQARQYWAQTGTGKRRPRHATWRDPIVHWIESRQKALKEAREKKYLQKVEQQQLEARGVAAAEARTQAAAMADVMVTQAAEIKLQAQESKLQPPETTSEFQAPAALKPGKPIQARQAPQRLSLNAMLQNARKAALEPPPRPPGPGLVQGTLRLVFGVRTRFLLGAVLLGLCLGWVQQNPFLRAQVYILLASFNTAVFRSPIQTNPFSFPLLPQAISEMLFNTFNPGVAGLLLILSAFCQSRKALAAFFLGGLIVFLGQMGLTLVGMPAIDVPMWGPLRAEHLSLAAGCTLAALGWIWATFLERN